MTPEQRERHLIHRVYGNISIDRPHITLEFVTKIVKERLMSQHNEKKKVLDKIVELTREHGRVYFGIELIAEETDVPEIELYNHDDFTGILMELNDAGKIIVNRGAKPDVCLDSDFLC